MEDCVRCGAELREGANFCSACGAKVERWGHCPRCGAQLLPGDLFCARCGASRETDPTYFETEALAGGCRVKRYTGPDSIVVIPAHIGGRQVTAIGDYAFENCDDVTHVTIPESVTDIGHAVFNGCLGILTVHAPAGSAAEAWARDNDVRFQSL